MTKVNKRILKKRGRGRPATGVDPIVTVRLPQQTIDDLTKWGRRHGLTSRSEIIRELITAAIIALNGKS